MRNISLLVGYGRGTYDPYQAVGENWNAYMNYF